MKTKIARFPALGLTVVMFFFLFPQRAVGAILDAAQKGDLAAVKQAIADGENKNAKTDRPMFTFGSSGFSQDGEMSYQKGAEWTPLIYAAPGGHADIVQYLLAISADANIADFSGLMAFMYAISERHANVVAALAANEDALNFKEPTYGMTPLMGALVKRSEGIIAEILKANPGLAVADKDDHWPPNTTRP